MLEIGQTYPKPELSRTFGTRDKQGLDRKLTRYGIAFDVCGRGDSSTYTITAITDPFKVFAITELGFDGGTDFTKLRNFYYHFFEDEIFMAMPDEVKEVRMREMGQPVSRQTIANYTQRLEANNLINRHTNNFIYYFAYKQEQRIVDRSEYLQAWFEYWDDIASGLNSFDAIANMRTDHGGVARKQPIPEINGIYNEKIEQMLSYIQQSIEDEG
jgi:hypothetical protein